MPCPPLFRYSCLLTCPSFHEERDILTKEEFLFQIHVQFSLFSNPLFSHFHSNFNLVFWRHFDSNEVKIFYVAKRSNDNGLVYFSQL